MPWQFVFSLLHININGMDIRGNPLLNITGNGGTYIAQSNTIGQTQAMAKFCSPGQDRGTKPYGPYAIDRRIETQPRIRRKLKEACGRPGSIYGINIIAQIASDILVMIESNPAATFSDPLVCLAMDAHATAYIAVISCLYRFDAHGTRLITRTSVRKLRRFLDSLQSFLIYEATKKGILVRITRVFSKGKANIQLLRMQEELLHILRDIEKDENANVLTSLEIALDCPYQ